MQWFRMYEEFGSDPKIQLLPETFQRRYVMLLCLKCRGDIPGLSDEEIACYLRIGEDDATKTKERLLSKGLILNDWTPTAWDKRQFLNDLSTERVRKFRAKVKAADVNTISDSGGNEDKSISDTDTDTDTDTERNGFRNGFRNGDETFHRADKKTKGPKKAKVKDLPKDDFLKSSIRKDTFERSEFVYLTDTEMNRLIGDHGQEGAERIIEILDSYKANAPGKCFGKEAYLDDYRVIVNWVVKRYKEEGGRASKSGGGPPRNRAMDQLKLMVEEEDRRERAAKGGF